MAKSKNPRKSHTIALPEMDVINNRIQVSSPSLWAPWARSNPSDKDERVNKNIKVAYVQQALECPDLSAIQSLGALAQCLL